MEEASLKGGCYGSCMISVFDFVEVVDKRVDEYQTYMCISIPTMKYDQREEIPNLAKAHPYY